MAGSNSIDRNKLQKVETPYGNGYYYNGKLYSDQEFESLENSFKDGGNKTPKPGDPGYTPNKQNRDYTVSKPAKKPSDQEFTQFVEPEDSSLEPLGNITSQGNVPAGNPLPKGFNQGHIDMIYANPSTNQFQIQAFENQYGSGFRPGSKSVPATQYDAQSGQAQTPSLANMMDANAQPYTSEYGAYGDVVQRGGDVAEGVSLEGGKVTYENPIYENALRGNWTGENVATEVMPAQGQANPVPTQAGAQANAVQQPQIGAPAKTATAKPAQAKAAPNKPSANIPKLPPPGGGIGAAASDERYPATNRGIGETPKSKVSVNEKKTIVGGSQYGPMEYDRNTGTNRKQNTAVPINNQTIDGKKLFAVTADGGKRYYAVEIGKDQYELLQEISFGPPTSRSKGSSVGLNQPVTDEQTSQQNNPSRDPFTSGAQKMGSNAPANRPAPQQSGYKETGDTFISKGKTYKVLQSSTGKKFYKDGSGMHPISNDATLNK
jgi:hypothetical protein